jgi:hypothetical protein
MAKMLICFNEGCIIFPKLNTSCAGVDLPQRHHQQHYADLYVERVGWRNTIQTDGVLDRQQCVHREPALQRHLLWWCMFVHTPHNIERGELPFHVGGV